MKSFGGKTVKDQKDDIIRQKLEREKIAAERREKRPSQILKRKTE